MLGILINRSKYGFHIYSDPGSISNEFNEATSGEDDNNIRWSIRNWYEQIDKCPPLYTPVIIAGKTVCWMLVLIYDIKVKPTGFYKRLRETIIAHFRCNLKLIFYNTSMNITTISSSFVIFLLEWHLIVFLCYHYE